MSETDHDQILARAVSESLNEAEAKDGPAAARLNAAINFAGIEKKGTRQ
jgi:hypothetical protein